MLQAIRTLHDAPLKALDEKIPKKSGLSRILSKFRFNQRSFNHFFGKALIYQTELNEVLCETVKLLDGIESRLSALERSIQDEKLSSNLRFDSVAKDKELSEEKLDLQLTEVLSLATAHVDAILTKREKGELFRVQSDSEKLAETDRVSDITKLGTSEIVKPPPDREAVKVLYVANAYPPNFIGGAELVAHNHAKSLRMAGVDVRVFAGDHSSGDWHEFFHDEYEGVPVWRLRLDSRDLSLASASQFINKTALEYFDQILSDFKPDLVHCHNLAGLGVSLILVAWARSIPVVLTVHDHWGYCLRDMAIRPDGSICQDATECWKCMSVFESPLYFRTPVRLRRDFHHWCLSHCSVVFSPSQFLASKYEMRSKIRGELRVFWNGVDCSKFAHLSNSHANPTCRFTFIGYLGDHKGVIPLLQAFSELRDFDVTLAIVGVGYLEAKLKEMVVEEGIGHKVQFMGRVPNQEIPTVFEQTDVFVLPSTCLENQPVSIAEAMASGCPIIASNCGGIPEMVEDGVSGILCAPGNTNELCDAMIRLAANPRLRRDMGGKARAKITDVSYDRQMTRMLSQYEKLIAGTTHFRGISVVLCHGEEWSDIAVKALEEIDEKNLAPETVFLPVTWLNKLPEFPLIHWAVSAEGIGSALRRSVIDTAVAICPGYLDGKPTFIEKTGMGLCYADVDKCIRLITTVLAKKGVENT